MVEDVGTYPLCVEIIFAVGKQLGFDLIVLLSSLDGPLAGISAVHASI